MRGGAILCLSTVVDCARQRFNTGLPKPTGSTCPAASRRGRGRSRKFRCGPGHACRKPTTAWNAPPWRATLWLGLTQTTGFTGLTHLALVAGGAGKVSVLAYTMPFWTLPLAWLWLGERVRGGQWLAIGLALLGLLAILEPWRASHTAGLPEVLALAGGVSWAASAIIAKQLRASHQVDVLALTFWQMLYGLPPLLALAWLWPGAPTAWAEPGLWLTLGFAGVFAGGIGWLMWLMLLGRLSAGAAGLNVLIIPAIAVLAAWLQLGEQPSSAECIGMALIALALTLLALRKSR